MAAAKQQGEAFSTAFVKLFSMATISARWVLRPGSTARRSFFRVLETSVITPRNFCPKRMAARSSELREWDAAVYNPKGIAVEELEQFP